MASTDALPLPRKNVAYRAVFPLLDADGDLVTGAAGLDSEVSKDQGTFADCTNEATEIATSSGMYYLDLTSTEMNADCVAVIVKTSTSGAKTTCLVFYPQESGDIKVDVQSLLGTAWLTPGTAGTPDVNVKLWNALSTVELPLVPTTAGRKLDVSAGGEAGLDWANVGSPTTALDLSGTTIKTTQKVDVDTIKTNPVVNGGTITFPSNATVASTTGAVGSVTGAVGSVTGAVGSVTGAVGSVTGAVGSVTGNVGGNVTGSVGSVATGGIAAASFAAGAIDAAAIAADAIGSSELAATAATEIAAAVAAIAMADPSAVPAVTATLQQTLSWILALSRNKVTQTSTEQKLYQDDGSTLVATSTHSDDATTHVRGEFA